MWQRHRILWTSIACGWLLIAFSFTLNYFLFALHYVEICATPPTFGQMLVWEIPYQVLWAMLAPVVFTITRRFPLERQRWLPHPQCIWARRCCFPQYIATQRVEVEFLRSYLDIERLRFQDRLHVELDIEPETLSCLLAAHAN